MGIVVVLICLGVVVVAALGWAYRTAHRLDRLNVRVDLARQSLLAALDRRAVVARTIGAALRDGSDAARAEIGRELMVAADLVESVDEADRETAENQLSSLLGQIGVGARPVALATELADAETRVMIARRFYNDAVRDTRNLALRRPVRWLRLAGRAAPPRYFEIIERVTPR
ncbi:LemA family protein [Gordonia sp. TBRC 11910]|uniref:LemA family protein n=1 Tax=Gordonia asplenii TaxID=2725283 RepID=A0A848KSY7_9ACTN|nr:NUDIX hydrolase [Gordonia asplenii]NMN99994.1 LemA family protein [Gordonia asplenii]